MGVTVDVLVTDPHGHSVSRTVLLEDETIEVDKRGRVLSPPART
jgi:hypothetical protein